MVVSPTAPTTLRPSVELRDPSRHGRRQRDRRGGGQATYVQAVPTGSGGVFTVVVTGAAGTTGTYRVQVILNADLEDESAAADRATTPPPRPRA